MPKFGKFYLVIALIVREQKTAIQTIVYRLNRRLRHSERITNPPRPRSANPCKSTRNPAYIK